VVVRYRIHLEARNLAAATINQRLAAVRRLALEAADSGPLSSELAAGIQRVKGAKQIGHRSGNWLTLEQGANLLNCAFGDGLRTKRLCHAGDVTRLQSSPVRVGRVGNRKDSNAAGTLGDC